MRNIVLSIGAVVALSSIVVAEGTTMYASPEESGFYLGVGIAATSASTGGSDISNVKNDQDRVGSVILQAGYELNKYFAVEGRYTTSIADEDKVEVSSVSIFAKPQFPVSESLSVYGLLGYGNVTMDGVNGAYADIDDSGFQWGLGLDYEIANNTSIFFDYVSLASDFEGTFYNGKADVDTEQFTVGVSYKF